MRLRSARLASVCVLLAALGGSAGARAQPPGDSAVGVVGGPPQAEERVDPLLGAVEADDPEALAELLDAGADLDRADDYGNRLLHLAARSGAARAVTELLRRGAAIDAANIGGLTALHMAAGRGHREAAAALLGNCALVDARDALGATPLHRSVSRGHTRVAELLLDHGANPLARARGGTRPLRVARSYQQVAAEELLERRGGVELPPEEELAELEVNAEMLPDVAAPPPISASAEPRARLETPPREAPVEPGRKRGVSTVQYVQGLLTDLGHRPGGIDGRMGPRTRQAIAAFQVQVSQLETGGISQCLVEQLERADLRRRTQVQTATSH